MILILLSYPHRFQEEFDYESERALGNGKIDNTTVDGLYIVFQGWVQDDGSSDGNGSNHHKVPIITCK